MKIIICLLLPLSLLAQRSVDSTSISVQQDTAGYYFVTSAWSNGVEISRQVSPYYDSTGIVETIQRVKVRGGRIGAVSIMGEEALSQAYETIRTKRRLDREQAELERVWNEVTRKDFDQDFRETDYMFLGYWTLYTPSVLVPEVSLRIFRNTNGVLRVTTDLLGNGRANIKGMRRIEIVGLDGIDQPLVLFKPNANRDVLVDLNREYRLIRQ